MNLWTNIIKVALVVNALFQCNAFFFKLFFLCTRTIYLKKNLLSKTLKSTSNKHKPVLLLTVLQYDRNEMLSRYEMVSALECALEYGCFEFCFKYFGKYAFGNWAYLYFIVSHLSGTFFKKIFLNVIAAGSVLTLDSQKHCVAWASIALMVGKTY